MTRDKMIDPTMETLAQPSWDRLSIGVYLMAALTVPQLEARMAVP